MLVMMSTKFSRDIFAASICRRNELYRHSKTAESPSLSQSCSVDSTPNISRRDEVVVSTELYKVFKADGASTGEPTPEGVHQDDQELVVLTMVGRENVTGAEARI